MDKEASSVKIKIIGLISVFVVLALVFTIYIAFGSEDIDNRTAEPTVPPPTAAKNNVSIFNLDMEDILFVRVKHHDADEFELSQSAEKVLKNNELTNEYSVMSNKPEDSDQVEIYIMFAVLSTLKGSAISESELSKSENIDEDYGFDKATKVTLEMRDGTEHILLVGDFLVPEDAGVYVRKDGEENVYVVSYNLGYNFKSTVNDYKNKVLLNKLPQNGLIKELTMYNDGKLQYAMENKDVTSDYGDWTVTKPISRTVIMDTDVNNFVVQFYNITASRCLGETDNLKEYGLLIPKYEIEYSIKNEKYKISLGNKTQDGNYFYMKWNDLPDIYMIEVGKFPLIDMGLGKIINAIVELKGYYELDKFEINFRNEEYIFDINAQKNEPTKDWFRYKGKLFTQGAYQDVCDAFRRVYVSCLGLRTYDYDFEAQPELKDPEITMKFYDKETKKVSTLDYVKRDDDRYYIFRNGEYTFTLARATMIYGGTDISDLANMGLIKALEEFEEIFKTVK